MTDRSSLILAKWDDHTTALGHRLLADKLYEGSRATALWFAEQTANIASAKAVTNCNSALVGASYQESFMNPQDIKTTVKTFILNEYLPGEDPAALTDTTATDDDRNP